MLRTFCTTFCCRESEAFMPRVALDKGRERAGKMSGTGSTFVVACLHDKSSGFFFHLKAHECLSRCNSQRCPLSQEEQHQLHSGDRQIARHVLLCLLLVVGLFANVSSCFWWLFNPEPGRLYVELQFFCAVFNFGQGFLSFAIFGLDKHLIILPCKKRLQFLWKGREPNVAAEETRLPEEIRMTCYQFVQYHKDLCIRNIVRERRCGPRTSGGIFWGSDLVSWLVEVGLASDRGEAVKYGERLLKGGVIQHITDEFEFRDENLYYRILKTKQVPTYRR